MNVQSVKQRYAIVGRSPLLTRALQTALRVALTDLTVLIEGESGVGKEVFSKIIHENSKRKHNPFIAINTGAIPEGTINSELFGHEKGAFTGAVSDRKGYFEAVNGGTIFLDEIGEMPLDTQAFLLRVLETGEFIKVGSSKVQKTDVRVIAATNVDLQKRIQKGKFREDLYYRLNTVPIKLPALHERREDIPLFFRKFAGDFAEKYRTEPVRLDERSMLLLENYRWPGNIRELRNLVEQLSVLSEENFITVEELIEVAPQLMKRNLPASASQLKESKDIEEREILYKFLFEMKNDLSDLKSLVFELIRRNDLEVPNLKQLTTLSGAYTRQSMEESTPDEVRRHAPIIEGDDDTIVAIEKPILISRDAYNYGQSEVVEENLSLEEKTKELILKALKKHKGRRKDAADELGISERTLYRKIKEYDIDI